MNKKTLSRIAALSIAAASAVSTLGMTASADVVIVNSTEAYVTELWELRVPNGNGYTLTYYTTEAQANAAVSSLTGNVSRVSTSALLSVNDKFSITNGMVTKVANGEYTYKGSSYNGGSGTSTGSSGYINGVYISSTYCYATNYRWKSSTTLNYYPNEYAMRQAEPNIGSNYSVEEITNDVEKWSSDRKNFNYTSGQYQYWSDSNTISIPYYGGSYTGSYNISTSYRTSNSSTVYYYNGVYYPNYNNMVASIGFTPSAGSYSTYSRSSSEAYSSSRPYFDPTDGKYYSTTSTYRVLINSGTGYGSYTVYYSTYTQKYYDTYSAATLATPSGYTVSTIPNSYYSASTLNTYGYSPYYYNGYYYNGNYYNGYYYNGYYYNGYYPWNYTTTATNDTSTVTIGKYKGWTNVIRYINASRSGASYDVNMKSETEIPSNVLKALKGKNVTLNLKFNSGAVLAVNGNDITSTDALTVNIKYDKNVPSSLAKKAVKANSGVASAQFSISGGSLGASASVTIKFSTSRGGCSAKLYRYNASANSLSLVSNSSVRSNGSCTFDNVKQGGDYVIVLS